MILLQDHSAFDLDGLASRAQVFLDARAFPRRASSLMRCWGRLAMAARVCAVTAMVIGRCAAPHGAQPCTPGLK